MSPTLWLPPQLPHLRRDPLLMSIGTLDADHPDGTFQARGNYYELSDAIRRGCGLVDPVEPALATLLWTAMKATPSGDCYLGPPVYCDPRVFEAPAVPSSGLALGEVIAAYAAASPAFVMLPPGRLAVRQHLRPPPPVFRRRVPRPALLPYPRHVRDFERWQAFESQLRALPSPDRLGRWYRQARAQHWLRYAIHRAFADLASGAIAGFEPNGAPIPTSYWESDIAVDVATGALYLANDHRVPLCRGIEVYPAGAVPAAAAALAERMLAMGKPAMRPAPARRIGTYQPRVRRTAAAAD